MLRDGGKLVVSVPTHSVCAEHFPKLHNYEILETNDGFVLVNATSDGELQIFRQLRFHGGPGTTLEMRIHSEASVDACLKAAGFRSWKRYDPDVGRYGIFPILGLSTTWIAVK